MGMDSAPGDREASPRENRTNTLVEPNWDDLPENPLAHQGSHLIGTVLTPAIRLWLSTQVERADDLTIAINSSDRQLLRGYIPQVTVSAHHIGYRGLHLGAIAAVASNIQINWWGILRGKALRLMAPFTIEAQMSLSETDLTQSLQTDLFATAVSELLADRIVRAIASPNTSPNTPLDAPPDASPNASHPTPGSPSNARPPVRVIGFAFQPQTLIIRGELTERGDRLRRWHLTTRPELVSDQTLIFRKPYLQWNSVSPEPSLAGSLVSHLDEFSIDLGDARIFELSLVPGMLTCRGAIGINP